MDRPPPLQISNREASRVNHQAILSDQGHPATHGAVGYTVHNETPLDVIGHRRQDRGLQSCQRHRPDVCLPHGG